jgi:methionyl-tRNA formyltransferase
MGTPEFAVPALRAIAALPERYEIVGVYSQPDRPVGRGLGLQPPPVKAAALALGLPVFQPEKLTLPGEYEKLAALRPEVIVVVAYGQILRANVLELPRLGCVNIHSSLLPRWRGAAPIAWALLSGDRETGITTMRMVAKLDAGDIYLQKTTPIAEDETAGTLHDRLAAMGAELILPTLEGLAAGTLAGQPQDEAQVTYASKLSKEMEVLDCSEGARSLELRVRALHPWPGTSVWVEGERLKIRRAKARGAIAGTPATVFEHAGMVLLGTASGALELQSVQWEGKREVDAAGFLNGLRGKGKRLPLLVRNPVQSQQPQD